MLACRIQHFFRLIGAGLLLTALVRFETIGDGLSLVALFRIGRSWPVVGGVGLIAFSLLGSTLKRFHSLGNVV